MIPEFGLKLHNCHNFVSHRNFMMLVLSRKLASRRKRDDQGTIGQLPAAVALLSYELQQRQAADRRPTMIIMLAAAEIPFRGKAS